MRAGLLAALILAAPGMAAEESDAPSTEPIRAACEVDYPPFCIVSGDGRADGLAVDLMRAALARVGRDVTFRTGTWPEIRGLLERGEIDALPFVGRVPEREDLFDFTAPYITLHGGIVVREQTNDIHAVGDLRGRRVGVLKGDNAEEFLRNRDPGLDLLTAPTLRAALRALTAAQVDAVVSQRLVALRLLEDAEFADLRLVDRPMFEFARDFCFAVREGDRKTLALLGEGLALVFADGTHRQLERKWLAHWQMPVNRPIVIGGDHNYPPFEYLDNEGRATGFSVELTRAIARAMGLEVRFRLGPWETVLEELRRGGVDAMEGMFYTPSRDRYLDFSPRYLVVHCISVTRDDAGPPPATFAELAGRDLVVQAEDAILDALAEHGIAATVTTVETQEEVVRAVAEGRHACGLATRHGALSAIRAHGWTNLRLGEQAVYSGQYCYAVPHGNEDLLAQFTEGLRLVKDSGEFQRLHEKWMGVYEERVPWTGLFKYLGLVVAPLLFLAILALAWSWSLRQRVASRTQELRDANEHQRAMIACSPVALYSIDLEGRVLTWNEAAERVFGWSANETIGKPLPIVPENKQAEFLALRDQVAAGGCFTGRELVRRKKGGASLPVSLSVAPIFAANGSVVGIMGAAEDISNRKQREARIAHLNQALRAVRDVDQLITQEEDRDRLLQRSCQILVSTRGYRSAWVVLRDAQGRFISAAESGIGERFAALRQEMERGDWPECCQLAWKHADGVVAMHGCNNQCRDCVLAENTAVLGGALQYGDHDFGVLVVALPPGLADDPEEQALFRELIGDLAHALYAIESTRQRRAEQAKFQSYVENAPYGILLADRQRRLLDVNPAACKISGYSKDELLAMTIEKLIDPTDQEAGRTHFQKVITEGRSDGECNILHKDGRTRRWHILAVALGSDHFLGFAEDVSERRQAEEEHQKVQAQLVQVQKMESVGRLAGGVAHDFNNLLMGILNYTELSRDSLDPSHPARAWLDEITTQAQRSANVARQLLAFASRQTIAPTILDLNQAIKGMLNLLRQLIGEDIRLSWNPAPDIWPLKLDQGQVDQLLVNLCVNARDAINGVGNVSVTTANVTINPADCPDCPDARPGCYVMLAVRDNGCGMDQDTLAHIFEPFFTTKRFGKGTGLGLATVYGIVRQNDGFITVESEAGQGAGFTVFLPRYAGKDAIASQEQQEKPSSPGGGETILLVEDEKSVRVTTGLFLERVGYRVLTAASPEDALRKTREYTDPVQLLITDVVMPGMNGSDLAAKLRSLQPTLKCLFISGYTADVIAHRGILEPDVAFLAKPFSRDAILSKVREVLDR